MEKCMQCKKAGEKLFLKGDRCVSTKCTVGRTLGGNVKGQQKRRPKKSEYGLQLSEKQKAKSEYGIRERQFANYFKKAARSQGATGEVLLQNLELRLDNVLYRGGFTKSRTQARQVVNHGHILVNGKKLDIPSSQVKVGDVITPANTELIKMTCEEKPNVPNWLKTDSKKQQIKIESVPTREEIETAVDEQLIVEFYSR